MNFQINSDNLTMFNIVQLHVIVLVLALTASHALVETSLHLFGTQVRVCVGIHLLVEQLGFYHFYLPSESPPTPSHTPSIVTLWRREVALL